MCRCRWTIAAIFIDWPWRGKTLRPMEITNFIKLYEKSFRENWELPALSDYVTGKTITYSELAMNIAKIHLFFNNMGIKPGAKVAICGRDLRRGDSAYTG